MTGFTFQQQVSVLSAAAEKTRRREREREPGGVAASAVSHTHTHTERSGPTHTRESVCGSQAGGSKKNTTVADQVAIKTVHSDPCLSADIGRLQSFDF